MPVTLKFELDCDCNNLAEFVKYRNRLIDYSNDHSNTRPKCTICNKNTQHKMRIQYGKCANENCYQDGNKCQRRYKTLICLKHDNKALQRHQFYICGKHNNNESDNKNRGISSQAKEAIEEIINLYDSRPKRILTKLTNLRTRIELKNMPTLKQIQNFVNNRRRAVSKIFIKFFSSFFSF